MAFDINFNLEKNELLRATREVCFDDVIKAIAKEKILADISHPNSQRTNQKIYIIEIDNYAYAVPYVINKKKKEIFLKTVYPSRVFTKKYLKGGRR
ncbi:MAG: toxin [Candidatus Pacebacteria bacterium]|jgi:hypothetical protein|nr:toxin [Candidatus Paceibacterota bacterium]MBT3512056.1 toxin [Candidatus Paceibacterota bacterium]MBT4004486.1 toxin [Candidatus Paceibacterota bacterium]MBT4359087.1 toxin [Candidatus Paceibacterota bacterium]MBT4681382.1 toxin [Candidatus Paceibacterota bacterium]